MSDPIDYLEEEQREQRERELKKPIKPTDPPGVTYAKCNFQDSVKYEFSPPDHDFIEHLLPSRRRL